ncbi:MAG TPA: hypothetical protein VHK68_04900, partial [Gemmatimonadales bacterium]|nr:hypothetical protein [Gemmatimonadales bacterium]
MILPESRVLFDQWLASAREVAVVGLGKSGVAATLLLRELGIPVYASDVGQGGPSKSGRGSFALPVPRS